VALTDAPVWIAMAALAFLRVAAWMDVHRSN